MQMLIYIIPFLTCALGYITSLLRCDSLHTHTFCKILEERGRVKEKEIVIRLSPESIPDIKGARIIKFEFYDEDDTTTPPPGMVLITLEKDGEESLLVALEEEN